ncbi:MAG: DMT family transporter [Candidatus Bipolaricaulota bacterium]|nr:DMT family transporter [Candidatus Bipolaricaulota bacterium]
MKREILLPSVLTLGIVVISFGAILIRLVSGASVFAISAWRLGVAFLILLPISIHRGALTSISKRNLLFSALSGFFLSLHFILWIASLDYTSVASSVVLVSTSPIFVGLGARLFIHESPSRLLKTAIALAVGGSVVIGWGDMRLGGTALQGDLMAIGGAIMAAGYLLSGRRVRQEVPLSGYALMTYGTATMILLIVCLAMGQPLGGFSLPDYVWLILLGLGPQLIGHTSLNWALEYLQASVVSIVTLGEPIGATILAYIIFGEALTLTKGVGGAIILVGIYLGMRTGNKAVIVD